jgi:hypothetical protein
MSEHHPSRRHGAVPAAQDELTGQNLWPMVHQMGIEFRHVTSDDRTLRPWALQTDAVDRYHRTFQAITAHPGPKPHLGGGQANLPFRR